ncbi:nicotinamide riboside transporter PnuC [Curvibacter sp. HBC61]|uniref:Nicotinamide riboside transporter PnuC n=1 Tax=Curvibacter cyanobacteriorum TaxID=3026422 RepID=A0ABT5MT16_9BURK|nr:nicotinamide riboside transporter PnuC [Curvibacter sp. HBC61]MDD0836968.1 nicotinamide riboside transporter PnuC [Curvibacter sp. HBC61]
MDALFTTAFELWGTPTSWTEVLAFALALAMVVCNIRQIHWGWPLAILSSLLYLLVFWRSRLYGDAVLQLFFAALAGWGWTQWLKGQGRRSEQEAPLRVTALSARGRRWTVLACASLWPLTGWFLLTFTDTDVPWWDAFPTAASLVGQVLLGRKHPENWLIWLAVNVVSMGLFAYKGLWLTTVLYGLFTVLSVVGWRAWRQDQQAPQGQHA